MENLECVLTFHNIQNQMMQKCVYIHTVNIKNTNNLIERLSQIYSFLFRKESVDGTIQICHVHTNLEIV